MKRLVFGAVKNKFFFTRAGAEQDGWGLGAGGGSASRVLICLASVADRMVMTLAQDGRAGRGHVGTT